MKLVSWNVNGICAVWKNGFRDFLDAEQPDILSAQKTKIQHDQLTEELKGPSGYRSYWSAAEKKGDGGTATFTREGPVRVATEFPDFHLFNVYFPNSPRGPERLRHELAFYDESLRLAEALGRRGKGIVVCCDVNTAYEEIDLARPKENGKTPGFLPVEREWMSRLRAHRYLDTFRLFTREPEHYTWRDLKNFARTRYVGWRVDYLFVSEELRPRVRAAGILPQMLGSDHYPITLTLG